MKLSVEKRFIKLIRCKRNGMSELKNSAGFVFFIIMLVYYKCIAGIRLR